MVPQGAIDELNEIVTRRANSTETERWHNVRRATTENRLFEGGNEDEEGGDIVYQVEQQLTGLKDTQ
jgi:hypothetical protein